MLAARSPPLKAEGRSTVEITAIFSDTNEGTASERSELTLRTGVEGNRRHKRGRKGTRELSGGKETERLLNGRAGEGEGGSVVESAESHALMSLYFNFIHQTTETDSRPGFIIINPRKRLYHMLARDCMTSALSRKLLLSQIQTKWLEY